MWCILSKVLESIIYQKIIFFICCQISPHQFGILRNRSCLSQLLSSYSEIYQLIESGNFADVVYLDFQKAFDTIPHPELQFELWAFGITGPLWLWFRNYLLPRHHYVETCGVQSNLLPVISGVLQGSILRPLFFLIYINDLPNSINSSSINLFADDTKFIHCVANFCNSFSNPTSIQCLNGTSNGDSI